MAKKILFLSNKEASFLSTTIKSYLQEEKFEVTSAGFDADVVSAIKAKPKLILLNFEDLEEKDTQFVCYIRDLCAEEGNLVYLSGQASEVNEVASILPKGVVMGTCTRPFDIPELIKKMSSEIQVQDDRSIQAADEAMIRAMSMPKNILFISNKKTNFLSTTIKANLQQEDFVVMYAGFDVDEVNRMEERPNLVLMNIERVEDADKQFLFYIRDLCVEEEKRVYLCGHDNDIREVSSVLPKGSVVGTFTRPFSVPELVNRMNKEIDKYRRDQGKKHILVVDDSGEMLRTIRAWLSDTYRVSVVNSGANAILFLANQKPDLILLDYEMPFCSGPQMMEMIRAESSTSSIPIMFLTGKSDADSLKKVLSLKPEGYMLKSTKPDKIKETIGKFFIDQKAREYNKGK